MLDPARLPKSPILEVRDIAKRFPVKAGIWGRSSKWIQAVDGVSFDVNARETLGVVGKSGCGKTTLAQILMGLEPPTSGVAYLQGQQLFVGSDSERRRVRRNMQIVFQDPYGSLDPHMTLFEIVSEPWSIHRDVLPKSEWRAKVAGLLSQVGLDPSEMDRRPRSFSGGQRQRVGIARALALSPKVLILDEPVAALDVSIQAQIVELLRSLQDQYGLAMIFIGHDLAVVRSLAHQIAVMYMGRIVEIGSADAIYKSPSHPYTKALLSAVPTTDRQRDSDRITLQGEVPSAIDPPSGCHFRTRCWKAQEICAKSIPPLANQKNGQQAACFFPE